MYNYLKENESSIRYIKKNLMPTYFTRILFYTIPNQYFSYHYVSDIMVEHKKKSLESRFDTATRVDNTKKYHSYEPLDNETLKVKLYSKQESSRKVKIAKKVVQVPNKPDKTQKNKHKGKKRKLSEVKDS